MRSVYGCVVTFISISRIILEERVSFGKSEQNIIRFDISVIFAQVIANRKSVSG